MKLRPQHALVALLLIGAVPAAFAATTFTWSGISSGTSGDPKISTGGNWVGGTAPTTTGTSATDTSLLFSTLGAGGSAAATVDFNLDINQISFSGAFPAYVFSGTNSFGIGTGGINVAVGSGSTVSMSSGVGLRLLANQTWTIDGKLSVSGNITGNFSVTKTGTGSLFLNSGNSTYTGGTTLQSGDLLLDQSSNLGGATPSGPIGTGTLTVSGNTSSPRLLVTRSTGVILENTISLAGTSPLILDFQNGSNDFSLTLSGTISGSGGITYNGGFDGVLTLSGDNSFSGGFNANFGPYAGSIVAAHNHAFGTGMLNIESSYIQFSTSAPVIGGSNGGLNGSYGELRLNSNATLQIAQGQAGDYGGLFVGSNITVNKTGSATLTLSGDQSNYTGTTKISQGKVVAAVSSYTDGGTFGPFGASNVVLAGGDLQVGTGTTRSIDNPISFSGAGPSRLTGNATFSQPLTVGSNATLAPGISPGSMAFNAGLTFASGGTYEVEMQNALGAPGTDWDHITVAGGALTFSTATAPFNLNLLSIGAVSDFSSSTPNSWIIATANGSITGFSTANVVINTTNFAPALNGGSFSLSVQTVSTVDLLRLNFTPVPEPSTWALLLTGFAGVVVSVVRRRSSRS